MQIADIALVILSDADNIAKKLDHIMWNDVGNVLLASQSWFIIYYSRCLYNYLHNQTRSEMCSFSSTNG